MAWKRLTAESLLDRLDQTATWCDTRVDAASPATCLRTLDYCRDPFVNRDTLVFWVAQERANKLGEDETFFKLDRRLPLTATGVPLLEKRGRILAFFPDLNLYHGMEASECDGFIDLNNNPPCDTWLAYIDRLDGARVLESGCLLSWVPEAFVDAVGWAIKVNPEGCLAWLDEIECELSTDLAKALAQAASRAGVVRPGDRTNM